MTQDLTTIFYRYFDVLDADNQALLDEVFRLRYQVYCVENAFEDASQLPDGREIDDYDRYRAVSSLVRHKPTGHVAATVRLVLPDRADPRQLFPIEQQCAESFNAAGFDFNHMPRNAMAEISRFCVSKHFKRRLGEAKTVSGIGPDPQSYADLQEKGVRMIPHLTIGLFAAIVRMSAANGVAIWYAVMEPSLLRLLTRFGIEFTPIGGLVDYHGMRQPCYGKIEQVLAGIWEKRPDIWRLITDDGRVWPLPYKAQLEKGPEDQADSGKASNTDIA